MQINFKKLNPVGFHLLKLLQDPTIRLIVLYGGSSSGKSYSAAQLILIMTLYDGENTLVMRKVGASINKTIYEDFKVSARQLGIFNLFKFKDGVRQIVSLTNGSKIDFGGLDDPEKIKGISNYKRVFMDEWSEYDSEDFKQVRKRLRGKVGQQILTAFNPIKETHWIKKEIFDVEKWHDIPMELTISGKPIPSELTAVKSIRMNEAKMILNPRTKEIEEHAPDTVVIQTTYLNNFWVVGSPDGSYGYYDEQCIADFEKDRINDPDYYNVYALGEWGVLRTGSEFFGSFNRGQHTREVKYDPRLPIHLSVDNNVLPYISFTFWQVYTFGGYDIRQIDEICAESPNNTVRKAAKLVADRIKQYNPEAVYLHGDASTRAANNIDDEKRSWLDLLIDCLAKEGVEVVDCVGNKNPSVPLSGEFINSIFDGLLPQMTITIGENCKTSIEDYMSVQKDVNGAILKTRVKNKITMQTYEEHGHLCFHPDTLVSTNRGTKKIKDINIGDYVITENGWQRVYNSLCSIRKSQYFFVTLNGQRLACTYDHPIYTNRGFIPAYTLKEGDEIIRYDKGNIWKERLSSTTALSFIATLMANRRAIGNIIADGLGLTANSSKHICIAICGNSLMAQFQRAIVFTILMVITTIIHLLISPLCVLMNMKNCIQSFTASVHGRRLKSLLMKIGGRLPNGMPLNPGANGIAKMARSFGKISRCANSFVKCAVKPLKAIANILQNFALTTAKASGEDNRVWTMKSVFVRFVGLNLLSISTLIRNVVQGRVLLNIGGISDVYDISTDSHTFFANGILVHNSDTFRYVVVDILKDEFTMFSNQRKRNLYAKDGTIHFFNPETDCKYREDILYLHPNINGKFVMIHGKMCGDKWHIVNVSFRDTASTEEIKTTIVNEKCKTVIVECSQAYYPFVRELREIVEEVRTYKETADIDRRIAATSDYVRSNLLFSERQLNENVEYALFMNNMLDYNKSNENKEASAVLSGFIKFVIKSFSD
ncbi:MAG: PBSX family phage terminase large subunit [Muribaculum sp.]|nr:PBSX family phage terminase large subunit [Muribaculum sp.]